MRLSDQHDFLFTLRPVKGVTVHAFDANYRDNTGHRRIDVEVHADGKVVFPRGATWCSVPRGCTVDGVDARELVLSLVAMKPGDTDADYFESYTEAQLSFADTYGEAIDYVRQLRYCDPETGAVKKGRS